MPQLVVIDGPNVGKTYPLTDHNTLGTDPDNSIVLLDRRAAPRHACIERKEGRFVVVPDGSGRDVVVNGVSVDQERAIAHGDIVVLAETRLLFNEQHPTPQPETLPAAGEHALRTEARCPAFLDAAGVISKLSRADQPYDRLSTVYLVANAIAGARELPKLLERALEFLFQTFPAEQGVVFLQDDLGAKLQARAVKGVASPAAASTPAGPQAPGLPPGFLVSQEIVIETLTRQEAVLLAEEGRALMCAPLVHQGRPRGAIHLSALKGAFNAHELELLAAIAFQLAGAIEDARSASRSQEYNRALVSLDWATQTLSSYLKRDPILKEAASVASTILKCTKVSIVLLDADRQTAAIAYATGMDKETWKAVRVKTGEGPCGRVLSDGRAILAPDPITRVLPAWYERKPRYKSDSFIVVPIWQQSKEVLHEKQLMGAFNAADKLGGGSFTKEDLEFLSILASQTGIALTNAELYEKATVDSMTRLYVRQYYNGKIEEAVLRSEKTGAPLTLLMCDLDHFKLVNDTHGHQAGDLVLKESGQVVRSNVRPDDIPCRYGGEEIAVILPSADAKQGLVVAERIRQAIGSHAFRVGDLTIPVTVSIGCGSFRKGDSPAALLARADEALYHAKHGGRNRVVASDPTTEGA